MEPHAIFFNFLDALGRAEFVQAQRALRAFPASSPLHSTGAVLSKLVQAEQTFASLAFLKARKFRRDATTGNQLAITYGTVMLDLDKEIKVLSSPVNAQSIPDAGFFVHLLIEICRFVRARQELVNIYRTIAAATGMLETLAVLSLISSSKEKISSYAFHPFFEMLVLSFGCEYQALDDLLHAQDALSKYQFRDCTFLLLSAKNQLTKWRESCFSGGGHSLDSPSKASLSKNDTSKMGAVMLPNNFQWLQRLWTLLFQKSHVYFHAIVSKRPVEMANDFKTSSSASSRIDSDTLLGKIRDFHKKFSPNNISLIFKTSASPTPFRPNGFGLEGTACTSPSGLSSYPAIFSYPGEAPIMDHWPNIISIMQEQAATLEDPKGCNPVYFSDRKVNCTYFAIRVDQCIYLAVIFVERKLAQNDMTVIDEFLSSLARGMRLLDVIHSLSLG